MAWELDVYNICTIDECPKEEKHTLNRRQQACPEQLCSKGSDFFFMVERYSTCPIFIFSRRDVCRSVSA